MSGERYSVGYDTARALRALLRQGDAGEDLAAVERLEAFEGTAEDLAAAVDLLERAGLTGMARSLMRASLPPGVPR